METIGKTLGNQEKSTIYGQLVSGQSYPTELHQPMDELGNCATCFTLLNLSQRTWFPISQLISMVAIGLHNTLC
jgi:hypothetical protein